MDIFNLLGVVDVQFGRKPCAVRSMKLFPSHAESHLNSQVSASTSRFWQSNSVAGILEQSLPDLHPAGTPMRRAHAHESSVSAASEAIYAVVRSIPSGCVASYGQVARLAGLPGRARLVGRALAEAPAETGPLPWHRVINAQGRISLTGSPALEQRKRLRAEGVEVRKGRIDLRRHAWKQGDDSPLLD